MTYYLLDTAPNGQEEILRYGEDEMAEIFTAEQRANLAKGLHIIHHWPRGGSNHVITDMVVATRNAR